MDEPIEQAVRGVPRGGASEYDAVIVGASLAGCATAILLGRAGARVALVEKHSDADAFKRICSHFIQSSAVPTLQRLGVVAELEEMGAVRSRTRLWTRWGWILPPERSSLPASVNIRRQRLDPYMRRVAAQTDGVELMLGISAEELLRTDDGAVAGVIVSDRGRTRIELRAPLTIGADGRDSKVAELAQVSTRRTQHGRFAYAGYYEGPEWQGAPDGALWLLDPHMVGAFPTDEGLTTYACMPTHDRLPEFRRDPKRALESFVSEIPDAPPIIASRLVGPVLGKIDMTNVLRRPVAPGLALTGDAALAIDPLWGVGCGFALQTAEWLADSVAASLRQERPLADGLNAYLKRYAKGLHAHAAMLADYATGRPMNRGERLVFSAHAREPRLAGTFEAFGTRNIAPRSFLGRSVPFALAVQLREAAGGGARRRGVPRRSRAAEEEVPA